jgi:hypothetical protein
MAEPKASAGERTVNFGSELLGLAGVEIIPLASKRQVNISSITPTLTSPSLQKTMRAESCFSLISSVD